MLWGRNWVWPQKECFSIPAYHRFPLLGTRPILPSCWSLLLAGHYQDLGASCPDMFLALGLSIEAKVLLAALPRDTSSCNTLWRGELWQQWFRGLGEAFFPSTYKLPIAAPTYSTLLHGPFQLSSRKQLCLSPVPIPGAQSGHISAPSLCGRMPRVPHLCLEGCKPPMPSFGFLGVVSPSPLDPVIFCPSSSLFQTLGLDSQICVDCRLDYHSVLYKVQLLQNAVTRTLTLIGTVSF